MQYSTLPSPLELPHGADIHAFMERCVNDPSITNVLMFCDRLYCEKANQRRGGVGKETDHFSRGVRAGWRK